MRILTVRRKFSEGDVFPLFFWGDFHRGNPNCAKEILERDREIILSSENAMYVNLGDVADFIVPGDRRYKADHIDWSIYDPMKPLLDECVRDACDFESPVIDRCIAALDGNHELEGNKNGPTNVTVRRLERLGYPDLYCGSAAFIRIVFTDANRHACQAVINVHHGKKTAQSKATLLNHYLHKLRYYPDVDILARGHCHFLGVDNESRVTLGRKELKDKQVFACLTGGYLKTFLEDGSCYSEDADYDPMDLGMQQFLLHPSRKGVFIEALS